MSDENDNPFGLNPLAGGAGATQPAAQPATQPGPAAQPPAPASVSAPVVEPVAVAAHDDYINPPDDDDFDWAVVGPGAASPFLPLTWFVRRFALSSRFLRLCIVSWYRVIES